MTKDFDDCGTWRREECDELEHWNGYEKCRTKINDLTKAIDYLLMYEPYINTEEYGRLCLFCYAANYEGHKSTCPWDKLIELNNKE